MYLKQKRILAYILVFLMIFSQMLPAYAQLHVNFGMLDGDEYGNISVQGSVYGDYKDEPKGKNITYAAYDQDGGEISLNSSPINLIGQDYDKVIDDVYYYDTDPIEFSVDESISEVTVKAFSDGMEIGSKVYIEGQKDPTPTPIPEAEGFSSLTFNFNKTESYIEFTTRAQGEDGAVDYSNFKDLNFTLEGLLPEKLFYEDSDYDNENNLFNSSEIMLCKVDGSSEYPMMIDQLNGSFNNMQGRFAAMEFYLSLQDGYGFNYNTTYRIKFKNSAMNAVLADLENNVYLDETIMGGVDPNNAVLQINSTEGNAQIRRDLKNDSADQNTTPYTMELSSDDSLGANGKYIAYDYDFSKGYTDVAKVEIAANGNWQTPDNINISLDDTSFGDYEGTANLIDNDDGFGNYTFGISYELSQPADISLSKLTFDSFGEFGEAFVDAVNAYRWGHEERDGSGNLIVDYSQYKGNLMAYVYNSYGDIIAWKALEIYNIDENRMYINPELRYALYDNNLSYDQTTEEFDPQTNLFQGMNSDGNIRKVLELLNAGSQDRQILQGSVAFGEESRDFYISLDSNGSNPGDYRLFLNFVKYDEQWFNGYEIEGDNWCNTDIPVNPVMTNTITLSINIDGENYSTSFEWNPTTNELEDFLLNGFSMQGDNTIGALPENAGIVLWNNQFIGSEENLKLVIYTTPQQQNGYIEGESQIIATLSKVTKTIDEEDVNNKYYTFEYQDGDTFNVNQTDIEWLHSMLIYDDGADINVSKDNIGNIRLDKQAPNFCDAQLKGQSETDEDTFMVKLNFDENINLDSLSGNVEVEVTYSQKSEDEYGNFYEEDETVNATVSEDVYGWHWNGQREDEPYQNAIITFNIDEQIFNKAWKRVVKVHSVSDLNGNTYDESADINNDSMPDGAMERDFWIDSQIRAKVVDSLGNAIKNAEIVMVDKKPDLANATTDWRNRQWNMNINNKGILDAWLIPGSYYAYKIQVKNENGEWVETPIDFSIEIPYTDHTLPYYEMDNIVLPEANVIGSTSRENSREFKEKLLFVESDIYNTYLSQMYEVKSFDELEEYLLNYVKQNESDLEIQYGYDRSQWPMIAIFTPVIDDYLTNVNTDYTLDGTVSDFVNGLMSKINKEPVDKSDSFNNVMDIIHQFYIKSAETDKNGNFKIYLDPGSEGKEYVILGKEVGEGIFVLPTKEFMLEGKNIFTVGVNGFEFPYEIEFPPPVLEGYVKDSGENPIGNCIVEITNEDTGKYFEAKTDSTGYFGAMTEEEGTYTFNIIRSDWEAKGTGRLYMINETYYVIDDGTEADPELNAYQDENGTQLVDYINITAPEPNATIKVGIGRDNGELTLSSQQFYSIRMAAEEVDGSDEVPYMLQNIEIPARNGVFEFYIPDGAYKLQSINSHQMSVPSWDWNNPSENKYVVVTRKDNTTGDVLGETTIHEVVVESDAGYETTYFGGEKSGDSVTGDGYSFTLSQYVEETYEIDLKGYFDTAITFIDNMGEPLSNIRVNIEDKENWNWYETNTGSDGKAYFYFGVEADGDNVGSNSYRINGYDYQNKWFQLDESQDTLFTVTSDNTPTNKFNKYIVVVKPNFTGKVFDSEIDNNGDPVDADSAIEYAWLDIKRIADQNGQSVEEGYGTGTDGDGNFSMSFTKPGEYIINGVGSWDTWFESAYRFDVVESVSESVYGSVYEAVLPGTAIPIGMPINIGRPAKNFKGYLLKNIVRVDGEIDIGLSKKYQGYDGTEDWYHDENDTGIWMILVEKGISKDELDFNRWKYEKWVSVGLDGSFEAVLDNTKEYEVFAVQTPRRWYDNFDEELEVIIDQTKYSTEDGDNIDLAVDADAVNYIYPKTPNFSGEFKLFEGSFTELGKTIAWGNINLEKLDGTSGEWVELEPDGSFGKSLEEAAQYKINDINYEIETDEEDQWGNKVREHYNIRLNKIITIGADTTNINLQPNFKGVVTGVNIDTNNLWNNNVGVCLKEEIHQDDTGYDDYIMNPWKYEIWINGTYNEDNQEVVFYSFMDDTYAADKDGNDTPKKYTLMRIHDCEINEQFKLEKADGTTLSGDGTITYDDTLEQYTMDLDFSSNVWGVISDGTNRISNAWMNIQKIVEQKQNEPWTNNQWFGTRTDSEGNFALKLADGKYKIEGYNTEGRWDTSAFKWIPGEWVQVGYEFSVENGIAYDSAGNPYGENGIVLSTNVQGKVMKLNKSGSYEQVTENAWLSIWPTDDDGNIDWSDWSKSMWANINESGIFKMTLAPGKYMVTEVGGHNFWLKVDLPFEIDEEYNLVADENYIEEEDGKDYFIVKPLEPNLVGTVYSDREMQKPLTLGSIMVKPKNAKDDDWNSVRWINTDSQGNFTAALANGEWKIVEMSSWKFWERVNIPFAVDDDGITPTAGGMNVIEDGTVAIYPPEPNVKGIVFDMNGNQANDRAWLTIKPADASEYDWSNAIWTEYKFDDSVEDSNKFIFKLSLPDGEYKVVDVGGCNFWYRPDTKFKVENGELVEFDGSLDNINENGILEVKQPEPNVTGTAYGTINGEERPIRKGWINVARYSGDTQLTMDGETISPEECKEPYSDIYWNHTYWAETDESGNFSFKLDVDGTYRIVSVGGEGIWYQPNTEFTVAEDKSTELEIREPGANVTITIKDVPQEMISDDDQAWLDIYQEKNEEKHFMPVQYVGKTDGQFVFEATLKDGDYAIAFFGTPNGGIELESSFTVDGTANEELSIQNESGMTMVKGSIVKDGSPISEKAWIAITSVIEGKTVKKKVQTNNNGEFTFKLSVGTVWILSEIVTEDDGYIGVSEEAAGNYTYIISEEQSQSPIEWSPINISDLLN